VRVPEELTPYELGDRLQIGYQAVDWTANLGADPYNPAALEDSGLGGWTLGEAISTGEAVPFTVGAASGYRYDAVSASGDCGTVIIIFPSLGPAGSPPGRITITADEDTFDARQVFDDPLFIGVLDSVKAPQD
jgi:hypothetical protein